MSQAKHPTPHQDRDSKQGHHPDDAQEGPPEPAYATAYDHGNQDDAGQQRLPLLVVGVDTEQNQAVLFGDEGPAGATRDPAFLGVRSEEHTSELQSLMRISSAVVCLKKKNIIQYTKLSR